jgi:hypothetical protein
MQSPAASICPTFFWKDRSCERAIRSPMKLSAVPFVCGRLISGIGCPVPVVLQVAIPPPMFAQSVELDVPFVPMLSQWTMPPPMFMQLLV